MWADFAFTIKVARPGFWTTTIWFYLLPLGQHQLLGSWRFWLGLFYVSYPLGLLIYGCNDLVDSEGDSLNPRKDTFLFGARGTPAQLKALPWLIAAVQALFLAIFIVLLGFKAAGWLAAMVAATAIYNWPAPGLKGRPPFEVLNQAGYVLVFVISSWLNGVSQLPWPAFLFGALFAMHSHLFGEIMDIEPDRLVGRRTTAAVLGAVPTKWLIALFLLAEALLVQHFFHAPLVTVFLAASMLWFVMDASLLWRDRAYSTRLMRFFLLGWNVLMLVSMSYVWMTAALTHLR